MAFLKNKIPILLLVAYLFFFYIMYFSSDWINVAGDETGIKIDQITAMEPQSSNAGIAMTFDDTYIDQWYTIRDILKKYNAHATFFVSNYYSLSPEQITKLKTLETDGNEIAFHGYEHVNSVEYLHNYTFDDYMNNEIKKGVDLMKKDGFHPVDFSYPFGYYDPNTTQSFQKYFLHVRVTSSTWDDPLMYYQYGSNRTLISGIGIDDVTYSQSVDINNIYAGISTAKKENKILILYGHNTVANASSLYETSYDRLEKILKYAAEKDMKTFTISEIH